MSSPATPVVEAEPTSDGPKARVVTPLTAAVFLLALAVPVAYACYTHHVWEDFLITFRFSKNLAEGRGLTYNPPERVHGFTSPLGVLLPALFDWLLGRPADFHSALDVFRGLSALAFAGAAALTFLAVRRGKAGSSFIVSASPYLAVALLLLDPKSVSYSANGQEQALMLFCVGAGLYLSLSAPSRVWGWWGLVFALFQWTRPDGVLYCGALALANLVFPLEGRKRALGALAKGAAVGAALYMPWFVFTWAYFGSPIPQTVIAKSGITSTFSTVHSLPTFLAAIPMRAAAAYRPVFYQYGDWQPHVLGAALTIGCFALVYWMIPSRDRLGRVASLAFFLIVPYFALIAADFAWYYPPLALLGIAAFASGVPELAARYAPRAAPVVAVLLVALVGERASHSRDYWRLMKIQQAAIEDGNRTQIGLFLRDRVKPGETVYLEPLGYIGYFSNAHMLDHPGLVSPQVSDLVRHHHATFQDIIPDLKPDWVVLRFAERLALGGQQFFMSNYEPVKWFDVSHRLRFYEGDEPVPGQPYLDFDSTFIVFHKKPAEAAAATRP